MVTETISGKGKGRGGYRPGAGRKALSFDKLARPDLAGEDTYRIGGQTKALKHPRPEGGVQ